MSHKPIDPSSPIPEHCDSKKAGRQHQEHAEREKAATVERGKPVHRQEL